MKPNGHRANKPFTARSLVGMTMGARKRLREAIFCGMRNPPFILGADSITEGLRIGKRLRPCPGCEECRGYDDGLGVIHCDGSGVMPARKQR